MRRKGVERKDRKRGRMRREEKDGKCFSSREDQDFTKT